MMVELKDGACRTCGAALGCRTSVDLMCGRSRCELDWRTLSMWGEIQAVALVRPQPLRT